MSPRASKTNLNANDSDGNRARDFWIVSQKH